MEEDPVSVLEELCTRTNQGKAATFRTRQAYVVNLDFDARKRDLLFQLGEHVV